MRRPVAGQVALSGGDVLSARFLITATGFLSQPKTPDIPGITTFAGKVIHTTEWEDDFDPTGRRIGIIGTGATAVQLIPKLADKAARSHRLSAHPDLGGTEDRPAVLGSGQTAVRPLPVDAAGDPVDHRHHLRVDDHRRRGAIPRSTDPAAQHLRDGSVQDQPVSSQIRDKELRRKLTPDYDIGCKRPTFSNTYFRSFTKPHVHLQADGIERIEADGIVNADGSKTHIDTLVLATGFDLWEANFPAIEVIGRDGRNLGKWWRDTRFQAYQGVSMPYFPNYLSLASPFAFLGLNFFNTMEYQMRLMDRLFAELKRTGRGHFRSDRGGQRALPRPDDRTAG